MLLLGTAALSMCLSAQETNDSVPANWEREFELNEVVVVASRPVLKQAPDRIIYLTKDDPYALGFMGHKTKRVKWNGSVYGESLLISAR